MPLLDSAFAKEGSPQNIRSVQEQRDEFIWRAFLEVLGLLFFGIVLLLIWMHWFGASWENLQEGLFNILIAELMFVSATCFFKEPAFERAAKMMINAVAAILSGSNKSEDEEEPFIDGETILPVSTINKTQELYKAAVAILEATLKAKEKEVDGETITKKLFSWEMCYSAGLVSRWSDWNAVMQMWEEAGIAKDTRKRKSDLLVSTVPQGLTKLDSLMVTKGFTKMNGIWSRV